MSNKRNLIICMCFYDISVARLWCETVGFNPILKVPSLKL